MNQCDDHTSSGRLARKDFLKAYERTSGNISASCAIAGISRQTYYRWIRGTSPQDKRFRRQVELIRPVELKLDIAEWRLMELAKAGNVRAVIYALKTFGKDRGWGTTWTEKERQNMYLEGATKAVEVVIHQMKLRQKSQVSIWVDLMASAFSVDRLEVWNRLPRWIR